METVLLVGDDFSGQWDHFYAKNRNKVNETWPLCAACNQGRATTTRTLDAEFMAYQQHVKRFREPLLLALP